jgi:CelD/BcsL family acetyltransferase involved in cellulose biosynthesis
MLRITTVLIGGRLAAVDMGAIWNGTYTVLAGGTDADFPGVAKLINLHHLEWACQQRMTMVDFLCGDFNWKERFHLTPRQLYQIIKPHAVDMQHESQPWNQPVAYAL